MWQQSVIFPDPKTGWGWAQGRMLGLPHLVRVLMTLQRAGIRQVVLPAGSEVLQPWLRTVQQTRHDMPDLIWGMPQGWPHRGTAAPVLGIRGGVLFTPSLLRWFADALGKAAVGAAVLTPQDTAPVVVSWRPGEAQVESAASCTMADIVSHLVPPARCMPSDVFCQSVHVMMQPGGDRLLLATVGKPTDRWHVRWVRGWTFPAMRWLASSPVKPNHITVIGFFVALVACWLIARGTYWIGIAGALLLYVSWVLDCMDGTLARLTYAESAFGQKLDTILGHMSNLAIFGALVWAVYGDAAWWKAAGAAFFLLGGILVAQRVSEKEKRLRASDRPLPSGKLQRFLDKINHRDYAVVILALMVVRALHVFLWLSLIGVQIYWLTILVLLHKQRRSMAKYSAT